MCIFCKIINGEIPSFNIYENENFKVILDKFPSSVGHALIIPKQHAETIFELSEETGEKLFPLAMSISKAIKKATNCDGINILQNNGEAAGQTVNHFHMHIMPRYKGDNVNIGWKTQMAECGDFERVLENLKENLKESLKI